MERNEQNLLKKVKKKGQRL